MAVREVLPYHVHPAALRKKSHVVPRYGQNVIALIKDLKDTLNAHPNGIGLAVPRINVYQRLIVACLRGQRAENSTRDPPAVFINPKITLVIDERKGFDAIIIHQEIDHLDGTLFIDRIKSMDDLYWIHKNENGEFVRVSLSEFDFSRHLRE
jgi:peptide deformylase